ncbi:hypothetical protein GQ54DRAFT_46996 [Martensiomyces pterosporus]|nr:hypothetical protein GQ54DRAFT_46996 [Martensiomyces pterosporus]
MAAIGKKRTADMATESGTAKGSNRHPCFWSVLHGESLNFVFVSASLHSFLGPDKASTMLNQSLFDYIHPDEATRARSDLVDTFISKSFVGSNIRSRPKKLPNGQIVDAD